ncbi:AraC family transcriptional regulator [Mycobacterium intracellulare]|uniref:AraC family transcriptional regulator n=1 Tax=Mycobacterium intracellulare TaxID=1767 RepID=UPI00334F028F
MTAEGFGAIQASRPVSGVHDDVFLTRDIDEAHTILSRTYRDHSIRSGPRARRFELTHRIVSMPDISIGYNTYAADVRIMVPPPQYFYIACIATKGHFTLGCGREYAKLTPGQIIVAPPDKPLHIENWDVGSCGAGIRISRHYLESSLAGILGRPVNRQIDFMFARQTPEGRRARFQRILEFITQELGHLDRANDSNAHSAIFSQLLVESLLVNQPHEYSSEIDAPAPAATPRAIREAVDFINDDPAAVSTVTDIARMAMVSVRSLEAGFRKHLGISPMSYVKEVRLMRVHDELANGDPSRLTVTAAARRWGFTHLGRFSELYYKKYDVLPSQTLRRG